MTTQRLILASADATDAAAQACTESEDVTWSRSGGLLSQAGSADSRISVSLSDEAADAVRREARLQGMTTSEWLRVLILTRLYGVQGVASMTAKQLALVAGIAAENAQEPRP